MYPYRKRLPSVRNESSVDRGDTDQIPYESYSNTTSKSKNCQDDQDVVVNGSITRLVGFVKESIYNVTSVNTSHDVYGSRESSVDVASDSCVDPVTKNVKLSKLKGCVESFGDNNNISNNKNDVYAEEKQRTNTKERYGTSYTNVTQMMPYFSVKKSNRLRSKSQKKESKPSKVLRKQTKGLDLNRPVGRLDSQHLSKVAHTAIESRLLSKGRVSNAPHVLPNRDRSSGPHEHSLNGENREDPESNITSSNSLSEANLILEQGSSVDTLSEFARQRSISCQNTLFPPETMSYDPRPRSEQISRLERKKRYEPLPKKDQSHAIIKKLAPAILTPILDTKEIHIREVLTKKASVQQKNILRNPNQNRSVKAKKINSPRAGAHIDSSPVIEKPTNVLVLSEQEYVRLAIQKRKPKFQAKKNIYDYDKPDSDGEHVANDLKTAQLGFEECLKCVPQWEDTATSQMPGKNESQYEQSHGLADGKTEIDLYLVSNDSSCDQNKQTELKRMKKKKKKRDKKKNSGNPKLGGPALTGRSSIDPAVTSSSLPSDSSENESINRSRIRKKTSKRSKDSARRWPDPSSFGDTKTVIKGVENVPRINREFTDDVPRMYRECTGNVPKMYRECTKNVPVEMSSCSEQEGGGEEPIYTHSRGYQSIFQEPLSSCFPPTAMSCDVGTRSKQIVRLGKGGTCQNLTTPNGMLKRSEIFTHDIFDKGTSRKDILQQMNSLLRKNNQSDQNNQVKTRSPASRNFSPRTNVLQETPLAQIVQEQAGQPDVEPTHTVCNGLAPFESEAERRAIQRRGKGRKRKTKKVYKKDQKNYQSKLRVYRNRIAPTEDKRPEGLDYMNTATQGLESCLKTLLTDCGDERPNYETTTSNKSLQSKTDECDARSDNASKVHRFDQIESNKVDVKSIQSQSSESSDSAKEIPPTFRRDNAMKSPPAFQRLEKYPSKKRILSCKHVTIPTYPSGLPILDTESIPEKHLSKIILTRSPVIEGSSITSEEEKSKYSITSKDENRKGGIFLEEEKRKCDITSEEDKSKDSITSEEESRKSEIISEEEKGKCDITSEEEKSNDSITSEEENHKGGIVSEEEKRKSGFISEGAKRICVISPKPFIVSTNSMLEEKLILDADSLSECARKQSLSSQPPSIFNKTFFPPENMSYDIGSRSEQITKLEAGCTRRYNPLPKKENTPVVTKVTPNQQNKDYHRIFNKGSKQGSVQLKNVVLNKHNQQHINNKVVPRKLSSERYGPPVFNILNDLNSPMHISAAKSSSSDEHQELDYFKPINGLVPSESQYKRLSIQKRKKKKMRADMIRKMSPKKIYNFDQQPSDLGEKLEKKLECEADNPESANNMPKDDSGEPQKKDTVASKISTDNITHVDTGSRQTCPANLYNREYTGYKKTIARAENADRSVNNIHSSNIENQSDKGLRSTAKESHGISSEVETPTPITPHQGLGVTGKIYEYLTAALNVTRIKFNKDDKEKTINKQQPSPLDSKSAAASEPNLPVIDQSDVCQESEEHKEDKEPSAEHFGYSETEAVRADNITKTLLDKRNPQSRSVPVPVDTRNVLNPSPSPMPLPRNRHPASCSSNAPVTYNRKCVLSPKQLDIIKSPTRISESLCDIITELRSINSNLDDVLRNEESCESATNYSNDKDLGSQVKHTISELLTHIDGQTVDQPTLEKTTERKYKANAKVNTDSGGEFSTDTSMSAVSFETVTRKLNESLSDQKLSKGFYDDNDDFDDMDDIFDENDPYGVDSDSSSSPFSHVYEGLISLEDLKIKQPNNRPGSEIRDQGEMSCDMSPDPAMDVNQRRWQIIKQSSPLLSKPTTPKCDEVKYDSFQSTNKPMKFKDAWLPKDEVQFEDTTRYNIIKDYEKKSQGAIAMSPKLPSYIEMPKPIQIEPTPSKPGENIVLKERLYESFTIGKQKKKMCNVDHNTLIETQKRKSYPTPVLETSKQYDKDSFSDFEKIVLKPKALSDKRPPLTKAQQQLPKNNVVSLSLNEKIESNTFLQTQKQLPKKNVVSSSLNEKSESITYLQAQKQLPKKNVIRLSLNEHIENKTALQNSPKYLTSAEVLCDLENALGSVASGIVKHESLFSEDQQPSSSKPDQSEWIGYAYARETLDNIKDYVTLDQDGDPKKEIIGVRRNFNKAMKRFNSAGPSFIWDNVVSKSPGSGVGAEPSRKRSFSESSGENLDVAPKKSNSLVESISGYMSYDEDGCPKKEVFGFRRGLKRYAGYIGRSSDRTVSSDGFSTRPTQRLYTEVRLVSNGAVKEHNMNQQSVDECSTDDDSFTNSSCLSMSDTHVKSCSSDFGEESGHSLSHSDISPMVCDSKPVSNTFEDIGEDIRLAARAFKSLLSDSNSDTSEHYNERIVSMISSQTVDV